jgi:NAD(P)-dependent dehydrogenase (short-subunit alcohol dehydrogenase family)
VKHGLDDWHAEVDNNLLTAFLASREVFPHMVKAGGGSIINFSRAGGPQTNMVAYNCAKAGVEALTRTLALEGRDIGIRVNAIAPGLVDTESNIAAMKPKDLKHWTKRDDIASTVVFLASSASAGVTGQVLPVTGLAPVIVPRPQLCPGRRVTGVLDYIAAGRVRAPASS